MKDNYESDWGSPEIPPEDCSDDEVWNYALSFKGYTWTNDMFKEGRLEAIQHEDETKHLASYDKDWRNWEDGGVMLTVSVAAGKHADDCSIEELRTALFMEQRGTRNSANWANDDTAEEAEWSKTGYARDLMEAIREKL